MSYGHKFKAKMPRENPEKGKAFIVVSIKDNHGNRAEYEGSIDNDKAFKLLGEVFSTEQMVPRKVSL